MGDSDIRSAMSKVYDLQQSYTEACKQKSNLSMRDVYLVKDKAGGFRFVLKESDEGKTIASKRWWSRGRSKETQMENFQEVQRLFENVEEAFLTKGVEASLVRGAEDVTLKKIYTLTADLHGKLQELKEHVVSKLEAKTPLSGSTGKIAQSKLRILNNTSFMAHTVTRMVRDVLTNTEKAQEAAQKAIAHIDRRGKSLTDARSFYAQARTVLASLSKDPERAKTSSGLEGRIQAVEQTIEAIQAAEKRNRTESQRVIASAQLAKQGAEAAQRKAQESLQKASVHYLEADTLYGEAEESLAEARQALQSAERQKSEMESSSVPRQVREENARAIRDATQAIEAASRIVSKALDRKIQEEAYIQRNAITVQTRTLEVSQKASEALHKAAEDPREACILLQAAQSLMAEAETAERELRQKNPTGTVLSSAASQVHTAKRELEHARAEISRKEHEVVLRTQGEETKRDYLAITTPAETGQQKVREALMQENLQAALRMLLEAQPLFDEAESALRRFRVNHDQSHDLIRLAAGLLQTAKTELTQAHEEISRKEQQSALQSMEASMQEAIGKVSLARQQAAAHPQQARVLFQEAQHFFAESARQWESSSFPSALLTRAEEFKKAFQVEEARAQEAIEHAAAEAQKQHDHDHLLVLVSGRGLNEGERNLVVQCIERSSHREELVSELEDLEERKRTDRACPELHMALMLRLTSLDRKRVQPTEVALLSSAIRKVAPQRPQEYLRMQPEHMAALFDHFFLRGEGSRGHSYNVDDVLPYLASFFTKLSPQAQPMLQQLQHLTPGQQIDPHTVDGTNRTLYVGGWQRHGMLYETENQGNETFTVRIFDKSEGAHARSAERHVGEYKKRVGLRVFRDVPADAVARFLTVAGDLTMEGEGGRVNPSEGLNNLLEQLKSAGGKEEEGPGVVRRELSVREPEANSVASFFAFISGEYAKEGPRGIEAYRADKQTMREALLSSYLPQLEDASSHPITTAEHYDEMSMLSSRVSRSLQRFESGIGKRGGVGFSRDGPFTASV